MIIYDRMTVGEGGIHIKPLYSILMKNNLGNMNECRTLIKHGFVEVNNQVINDHRYVVHDDDKINVFGKAIHSQPFVYYMMNKPKGYICANYDKNHLCVVDLIERNDCICVGRLDKDTTGFLLLTNDKSIVKALLLPQNHVNKKYYVTTKFPLKDELIKKFFDGVVIDHKVQCLPSLLEILDEYHCLVTINEGRYHQIKKMFKSCQNEVCTLKRIAFAGIELDQKLALGEYRDLTSTELITLFKHC